MFRRQNNLTQDEVAKRLRITRAYVQAWESGFMWSAVGERSYFPPAKHFRQFIRLGWPISLDDWHSWMESRPKFKIGET